MLYLDAGHHRAGLFFWPHLKDVGAIPQYLKSLLIPPINNEHEECEKLVIKASQGLGELGIPTTIVPFSYNLQGKIWWINRMAIETDILLSIHMNASTSMEATGTEVFYYDPKPSTYNLMEKAGKVAKILSVTTRLKDRGAKRDTQSNAGRLAILRDTKPLAYLLEMGFITNIEDSKHIRNFGAQAIIDVGQFLSLHNK